MEQEIQKCVELLNEGKVILYPTDTIWGIGCDATNEEAINRIYEIKQRQASKLLLRQKRREKQCPSVAWNNRSK